MKRIIVGSVLLAAFSHFACAEEQPGGITFGGVLGGAFTVGGDELGDYRIQYDHGGDSKANIRAGEQLYFYGGAYVQQNQSPTLSYGAQLTIGWMFDSIDADNGSVSLDRYPVEIIPYVRFSNVRLGLGLAKHTSIKFKDDVVYNFSATADDAIGTVLLAEYIFSDHIALGLRYVNIEYDFGGSEKVDATHYGIAASYLF